LSCTSNVKLARWRLSLFAWLTFGIVEGFDVGYFHMYVYIDLTSFVMCFFPVFASQHRHAHQGHGFRFIFVKSPFIIGYFCSTCHSKVCLSSMSLVHKSVCRIDCCCIFFSTDALHHCLLQFMPLQYRTYEPRHARVAVVCMRARHPRRMMSKTKHS
jgi:hypothetical protein